MSESHLRTGAGLSTAKRLGEETPGRSAQGIHSWCAGIAGASPGT